MSESIIHLKDVAFRYEGSSRQALDGITLDIAPGECVVILGPTGAGKSTLCGVLNGTIPSFLEGNLDGEVRIDGLVPAEAGTARTATHVGLVFGDPDVQLFGMTVEEDVAFGPANIGLEYTEIMSRVEKSLHDLRLDGFEKRAPHRLSGGQKQATAIAGVYAMLPPIMVLDEPTSMLDPQGKMHVFDIIRQLKKELGITVVLVEQEVDDILPLADRVCVMSRGRFIMSGSPAEVFARADELRAEGIRVPHLVDFGRMIGSNRVPFTIDEACTMLGQTRPSAPHPHPVPDGYAPAQWPARKRPSGAEAAIETIGLEHCYQKGSQALMGVDLVIEEGEFTAIVGQNGAGKTTLTRHFNGLLKPTAGNVRIFGQSVNDLSTAQLVQKVGYVFQNPDDQLFCDSVAEELRFGPNNLGVSVPEQLERVDAILREIGLEQYGEVWPKYLSKGERQRLALASVAAMDPRILIVDEPTTGLDWLESLQIMDYLKRLHDERGKTVLIITHDMNVVSLYAQRVIVMARGRLAGEGTPREVFAQPNLMEHACLRPPAITELSMKLWGELLLTPVEAAQRFHRSDGEVMAQ